ncbi:MAG: serine O-acetyltransferase EpsC [Bacteroidota bacterium]
MENIETFLTRLNQRNKTFTPLIPPKQKAHEFIDNLIGFLFPISNKSHLSKDYYEVQFSELKLEFKHLLIPILACLKQKLNDSVERLFDKVPEIYDLLVLDAKSILKNDPAAGSMEEIIYAYPGFYAVAVHRVAHEIYLMEIPILPRLISEYAHQKTGIDIHPGATIGKSFFIDHGTGIVIGETSIIGDNVKIYQGVTIGALSVRKKDSRKKRHPSIENDVTIYSGTTILGGETTIGQGSVIGGNVWLTQSVPANSMVYHTSDVKVRPPKSEIL